MAFSGGSSLNPFMFDSDSIKTIVTNSQRNLFFHLPIHTGILPIN